jgi:hypothetical protein
MDDKVFDYIQTNMVETEVSNLGLDPRAAEYVFVDEGSIAVSKTRDSTLQYYGGFEYVDNAFRREYGDYVFYLVDDDRVRAAIDKYFGIERPEDEEE